jgi:DNA repair protein RecO (recombination protein O)
VGLLETEAWVLRIVDLGEADRVIEFLMKEDGRKRAVARGARRRFSRYRSVPQPLSKVWVNAFEKEGQDLLRLRALEPRFSPKRLFSSLEGMLAALYVADLVATFSPENEPAKPLFRLLDATVPLLDVASERARLLRYVEIWVLRLGGIFPPTLCCPDCGQPLDEAIYNGLDGAIRCRYCTREAPTNFLLDRGTLDVVKRILSSHPSESADWVIPSEQLEKVAHLAREVRRSFLQREIPSYLVLERTLDTLRSMGSQS